MAIRSDHNPPESAHVDSESQRLRELIEPAVRAHNLFLEDVQLQIAGARQIIHVVVDLPEDQTGGVGLGTIAEVSGDLSHVLDEDPQDSGRPYELEVSSPGVSRPLTEPRHWRRASGRLVWIRPVQGEIFLGRLLEVDDEGVTIRSEVVPKKGMKPKKGDPTHIPFARIREGQVEIEFSHPGDAAATNGNPTGNSNSSAQEA